MREHLPTLTFNSPIIFFFLPFSIKRDVIPIIFNSTHAYAAFLLVDRHAHSPQAVLNRILLTVNITFSANMATIIDVKEEQSSF